MAPRKHESGPPMDLANMRRQGVRSLMPIASMTPADTKRPSTC
jgi:hypothetical protein